MTVDWFQRGCDAFTEGRPCEIADARTTGLARQKWHAGWHHQARLNTAKKLTPEARAEAASGIAEILKTLRTSQP